MQKRLILALGIGFVIGVAWLVALRFVTYSSDSVHYHASFALYVNGQQDKFDNFTYYEEVQACTDEVLDNPRSRVHMHNNVGWVVHVHDRAATWGHFFANLGYDLTDSRLETDDGVYTDGSVGELSFWLNGQPVASLANQTIRNEDRLLINYGGEDEATLRQRFEAVPDDAHDYNERTDPASCSGSEDGGWWQRLKSALGLNS